MRRENQNHDFALLDCARDLTGKRPARLDIAWRDPTAHSRIFESRADRVRHGFISGGMRNEQVVTHDGSLNVAGYGVRKILPL
jgi:hypothetical protein